MYPRCTAFLITCGQCLLRTFPPLFLWTLTLRPLFPRSSGTPRCDQACSFPSTMCSITTDTKVLTQSHTLKKQFHSMFFGPSASVHGEFTSRRNRDQAGHANAPYHSYASALHVARLHTFELYHLRLLASMFPLWLPVMLSCIHCAHAFLVSLSPAPLNSLTQR